jgi:ketosteroid isomerase-like protein
MVNTERAFSQASHDKGTRDAFLAFIAEEGILFRPTAVQGKKWMLEHPQPPSPKRALLSWQPVFADISQAGDLGFTFGPWQFKQDINDAKPVAFGHFITVWRKQTNGSWKFAVDLGISHPEESANAAWQPPTTTISGVQIAGAFEGWRESLLQAERDFSNLSAEQGATKAIDSYAADQIRLFREGRLPFSGKSNAHAAQPTTKGSWTWIVADADVSKSGDLGYSYGSYQIKQKDVVAEKGNYLRIWKKIASDWKVVVDVANPIPEDKKP